MNLHVRLRERAAQDVVQSVREQPSLVASLFSVYGALREVAAKKVTKPS